MHERDERDDDLIGRDSEILQGGGGGDWSQSGGEARGGGSVGSRKSGSICADVPPLPLNLGNLSVASAASAASAASWDGASERTLGTDAGTDPDIVATSGIPAGESDDDDDDDDDFEVADSRDLGAVNLCVSYPTARERLVFISPFASSPSRLI